MPNLFGSVDGGLLDDSRVLDSGDSPVLSDFNVERALRPEFEPEIRSRVAPLRERQAAGLSEAFDADFAASEKLVEVAEVFFPPLGIANAAHDAGMLLGEAVVNDSIAKGGLGSGLLGMAMLGAPGRAAVKASRFSGQKIADEISESIKAVSKDANFTNHLRLGHSNQFRSFEHDGVKGFTEINVRPTAGETGELSKTPLRGEFSFHVDNVDPQVGPGRGFSKNVDPKAGQKILLDAFDEADDFIGSVKPEAVVFMASRDRLIPSYTRAADKLAKKHDGRVRVEGNDIIIEFDDFANYDIRAVKPTEQTVRGFHGTGQQFDEFADRPTFFAIDKSEAAGYANDRSFSDAQRRVIEADLHFKNPASKDDVEKAVKKLDLRMEDFLSQADAAGNEAVVAELKSQGFDGAVGIWDFGFISDFTEIPVALTFGSGPIKQIRQP